MLLVVLVFEALLDGREGVDGSKSGAKFIGVFGRDGASDGDGGDGEDGRETERDWELRFFFGRGTSVGRGETDRGSGDEGREEGKREERLSKKESRVDSWEW